MGLRQATRHRRQVMARQRRDIWICDAPGCPVTVEAGEDTPRGYSGRVSTEGGTGCHNQPWYACGEKHITAAITWVAEQAQTRAQTRASR